jgi:hypothetical protein
MVPVKEPASKGGGKVSSPLRRKNSLKLIRGIFAGTGIANLRVRGDDSRPEAPQPSGLDVAREAGLGNPPRSPGRRLANRCAGDMVRSKDSPKEI